MSLKISFHPSHYSGLGPGPRRRPVPAQTNGTDLKKKDVNSSDLKEISLENQIPLTNGVPNLTSHIIDSIV
jgi:hypothetical protein